VPVTAPSGTRTAVVCRPNDPTGALPEVSPPASGWLILDEALAGFAELEVIDHPRVIQVRSFSKVHALAGLRVGYAIVPAGGPDLSPVLGVGAPALAAATWAMESGAEAAARRVARVAEQRARLAAEFPVAPGVGPYAWLALPVAEELAARRIYVAPGSAWGDERHVRVTLGDAAGMDRLLAALREL
jgi:histidinol-phosphate/aromatic aminotransferase/cobyric acid decarboxylase-like protein